MLTVGIAIPDENLGWIWNLLLQIWVIYSINLTFSVHLIHIRLSKLKLLLDLLMLQFRLCLINIIYCTATIILLSRISLLYSDTLWLQAKSLSLILQTRVCFQTFIQIRQNTCFSFIWISDLNLIPIPNLIQIWPSLPIPLPLAGNI